jgi:hypothetical protein
MSSTSRRIFVLAAISILAAGISYAGSGPKSIQWQTDLKKAQAAAAKQNKMLMVDFYGDH